MLLKQYNTSSAIFNLVRVKFLGKLFENKFVPMVKKSNTSKLLQNLYFFQSKILNSNTICYSREPLSSAPRSPQNTYTQRIQGSKVKCPSLTLKVYLEFSDHIKRHFSSVLWW